MSLLQMATGASVGVSVLVVVFGDMCSPTSFSGFVFDCYGMAYHNQYHVLEHGQGWKSFLNIS